MFQYLHNLSSSGYSFERSLSKAVQQWKDTKPSGEIRILDFGCGSKPFRKYFQDIDCNYIGLDVYPGEQVDVVYDGAHIPLEDGSIDLVFSVSVFEHVADLDTSLKEIARVLKPKGMLISLVPFINHVHGVPFDFHRPTRLGWEKRLKDAFPTSNYRDVAPVDARITCLANTLTAQINFLIFDLAHCLKDCGTQEVDTIAEAPKRITSIFVIRNILMCCFHFAW